MEASARPAAEGPLGRRTILVTPRMKRWERFALPHDADLSPRPLIAGIDSRVQGWVAAAAVLVLMAVVMYGFGRRAPRGRPRDPVGTRNRAHYAPA